GVDVHDGVPVLLRHVVGGGGAVDPRIVHQDVDAPELRLGAVDHGAEVRPRSDVARRPSAITSSAVRLAPAWSSSATTMSAPSGASSSAVARPIPRPAPVTMATCPLSSMMSSCGKGTEATAHSCACAACTRPDEIGHSLLALGRQS